ncbi:MAG: glutathione S-transferase family protein [Actinobacteria bacterium]|nr:glutathione S-transferase family protein [Actinomycetota bacterium]
MDVIRCYRIPFSTNVERVALAAGHKGVPIEWIDVDPEDRSLVQEISGQSLVPVVVVDGEVLTDSPRIVAWLEERFPDPPLYPRETARRAEVETFVDWFNLQWKRAPNLIAAGVEDADKHAARMREAIGRFEALLDGRDYLFGEFGVADVMAFPFLKYASFGTPEGDDELFHRILVEEQPLREDSPLHAWARRVDARPRS